MRKFYAALLAAVAAPLASGCADLGRAILPPPVTTESPISAQVRAAVPRNYPPVRLADVPPPPRNLPLVPAVKTEVVGMVRCRRGVVGFATTHPPLSAGPEQFAAGGREAAAADTLSAPPPTAAAASEGEAAGLRTFATPPAALASGPAPTADQASPGARPPAPAPRHPGAKAARAPAALPAAVVPASAPTSPPAAAPATAPVAVASAGAAPAFPEPLSDPLLGRCQ